jgi:hypothetical protein
VSKDQSNLDRAALDLHLCYAYEKNWPMCGIFAGDFAANLAGVALNPSDSMGLTGAKV